MPGEAFEAGATDALHKPIGLDSLVAAVERHLFSSDCPVARGSVGATTGGGTR